MDLKCTWDDFGTPKDQDLLLLRLEQAGAQITAVVDEKQWGLISAALEAMNSFQIHMHASQRRVGVIFVAVPTRGGLKTEISAIPRVKTTGLQMLDEKTDARSRPKPEIKILKED